MARAKKSGTEHAPKRRRLPEYEAKRDFTVTPEPAPGVVEPSAQPTYMIHKHHATRLHYDLRLEMDDALASWAVPKGPSYDPGVKRLAVQTEDHPLEYGSFEGRIPDGEYGGGDSLIWDRGTYDTVPPGQASAMRKKGHLFVEFHGEKLRGRWHLVRTRGAAGTKSNWILFKAKDETADASRDVVADEPQSVVSGRAATRGPERASARAKVVGVEPEQLLGRLFPPMLATLVEAAPEPESDWLFELKYDGYRAVSALAHGQVAMWTRNRLDLIERFPHLAAALQKLVVGDAVIDGEIVALDPKGASRFELLHAGGAETLLFAFDLLWLDGQDLRERPLEERRDLLRSLLSNAPSALRLTEEVTGSLADAIDRIEREEKEGLILKRRHSLYTGARSRDWLKLKVQKTQEATVIGFTESTAAEDLVGALLLAVMRDGELRFAGKVGTGFTTALRRSLRKQLVKTRVDTPAAADAPRLRNATWVRPERVAQVRFTEWTSDGKLRHPAFLGWRADKSPDETQAEVPVDLEREPKPKSVRADKPKSSRKRPTADARQAPPVVPRGTKDASAPATSAVTLTNPTKVLYPADGYTKQDVTDYYARVAEPMLRALADRPLALQHWPNGIAKATFFRQSIVATDKAPWMRTVTTPTSTKSGSAEHLVADSPTALAWLAQRATLTVHMWSSRAGSLDQPDWVVFDLDPGEGRGIEQAIPVAQALHRLFEQLSLPSVPKTTGKRGLHILVPLLPGHTHHDAVEFAVQIGTAITSALPEATLERTISKRKGRLYLDCHQNGYGKTIVAPYSPRALDGATVSAPLKWSEVVPGLAVGAFTIATMAARLEKVGDLFAPALTQGVRLPRFSGNVRGKT